MKILQLSFTLSSGGAERFVVDLCNHFAENTDNEIVLVITNEANERNTHYRQELSANVRFLSLGCKSGLTMKSFWRVFQIIRKEKPDVVHAHCQLLLLLLPALFFPKIKFFHTLHSLAEVCLRSPKLKGLYRYLYKNKVQAITISDECRQSFEALYHLDNSIRINNGRSPIATTAEKDAIRADVEKLKKDNHTPVFIHVARRNPLKNQKRLFSTFERLQQEGYDFLLLCIGSGYEQEYAPKYKDNAQIKILGEKKNVGDYLAASDFFVLSSDFEGLPISLLEAMSMGVVPISTPAGGVKDVIRDGENGFMCSHIDDEEFYLTVKKSLSDACIINKEKLIEEYEKNFSMISCGNKYFELYNNSFYEK